MSTDVLTRLCAIERTREQRGVSVRALCSAVKIAPSTWTRWKSGRNTPNLSTWSRVERDAEAFLETTWNGPHASARFVELTDNEREVLVTVLGASAAFWDRQVVGKPSPVWTQADAENATHWALLCRTLADKLSGIGAQSPAEEDGADYGGPVFWRGVSRIDPESRSGSLSFVGPGGEVLRFRLSENSLRAMAGGLSDVLAAQPVLINDHSDNSSGSPARDVSIPFEGENT